MMVAMLKRSASTSGFGKTGTRGSSLTCLRSKIFIVVELKVFRIKAYTRARILSLPSMSTLTLVLKN